MSYFRTPEKESTNLAAKRKLWFPIGEFAKQREIARLQAAKEAADADKIEINLRKKLSYRKQKVS